MCGIVGYVGNRSTNSQPALDILLHGLERLEYRGYDSAGIAVVESSEVRLARAVGRLSELSSVLSSRKDMAASTLGIGHTRWATHGAPTEPNAHPHCSEHVALVQNGIFENYLTIREQLESAGYVFDSETDTEVAAHLLHSFMQKQDDELTALRSLVETVEGSFAFVALSAEQPETLLLARRASPMVIGVGEGANYVASDVTAILKFTRKVIYLENDDYAIITPSEIQIYNSGELQSREVVEIDWDVSQAERAGYDHFLIKEIYDQPKAVNDTLSGRLVAEHRNFQLPELSGLADHIKKLQRTKLVACGTAWHAGLIGRHYFEQIARVPMDVEVASEFRYQNPIIDPKDLMICVSQSGETADTLAAVGQVSGACPILGVTNVLGSSLSREVDAFLLTQAGPEISVASTKAFTTQALLMYLLSLKVADLKTTISEQDLAQHLQSITQLSPLIDQILQDTTEIKSLAKKYHEYDNYFFIGRGVAYPVALEGALKLKEITYYSAQGYPAGELKHGPIALIDESVVTVAVIQAEEPFFSKSLSNLNEVKARKGKVIIISDATNRETELRSVADDLVFVPNVDSIGRDYLAPILMTIPLQLFAYFVAKELGRDIDFPRNLAKSVTVE